MNFDFTAWQIGKLIWVAIAAGAWGLYCGLTGRDLSGKRERPEQDAREHRQE